MGGLGVNSSTGLMDTAVSVSVCGGKGMYRDLIGGGVRGVRGAAQTEDAECGCA